MRSDYTDEARRVLRTMGPIYAAQEVRALLRRLEMEDWREDSPRHLYARGLAPALLEVLEADGAAVAPERARLAAAIAANEVRP